MNYSKKNFGHLADGTAITCWTIYQDDIEVELLDYGATIRAIRVPDKTGKLVDVVLGYDTIEEYVANKGSFGATIGRFANRVEGATFEIDGTTYNLTNNGGVLHIHGGFAGFGKIVWQVEEKEDGLWFSYLAKDGEEGYPGNMKVSVRFSIIDKGLELAYFAESDKDTIVNLTNHAYFNLDGEGNIQEQKLMVNSDKFTVSDKYGVPTGEIEKVEGTAVDFRIEKPMGRDADMDQTCVKLPGGYDTNFIVSGNPVAIAKSEKSGIVMTVISDQPGVQFYTANNITPRNGKNGEVYGHRCGFCLETQHYPDCIHHPDWPSCILRRGEKFETTTIYRFSLIK